MSRSTYVMHRLPKHTCHAHVMHRYVRGHSAEKNVDVNEKIVVH
jgi:hypothetical protein